MVTVDRKWLTPHSVHEELSLGIKDASMEPVFFPPVTVELFSLQMMLRFI